MLKLLDRYLLREMIFPFILGVLGFLIFVLLLILGGFSEQLVNGIILPAQLISMLLYRVPYFMVWAVPVALLFAILLALGRMGHDREVIALQSSGVSLRRLLIPFVVTGLLLSGIDLFISDTLVPWGNQQYYRAYLNYFVTERNVPEIQDNAFFRGSDDRFFFVSHYNQKNQVLENVMIYDLETPAQIETGKNPFPYVISAKSATWDGEYWTLNQGFVHQLSAAGFVENATNFEEMRIHVGQEIFTLALGQRSPGEMSLGELWQRIEVNRRSGLPTQNLLVDFHMKIAIPLMCLVFALFGAPLGLLIGPRGRALGIILSVLLVLIYQGLLFWTSTILANRGDLSPELGVWLPNLFFGLIGLLLLLKANQFGRVDITDRLRRAFPFVIALFLVSAFSQGATAQESSQSTPIELTADTLIVSKELNSIEAIGNVKARYTKGTVMADKLSLRQVSQTGWVIEAKAAGFESPEFSGSASNVRVSFLQTEHRIEPMEMLLSQSASVKFSGGSLRAERLALKHPEETAWEIEATEQVVLKVAEQAMTTSASRMLLLLQGNLEDPDSWQATEATVSDFSGESDFTNAQGQTHRLRYEAAEAKLTFGKENRLEVLDLARGRFTTCTCDKPVIDADYSIRAERLLIRPDEVLAAFSITLSLFGQPVLWAPAFLSPLGNIAQKYPFFPEIGKSFDRGYFAKWRFPFFVNPTNYGHILIDYYSRQSEVGTGLDLNYQVLDNSRGGKLSFFRLVGPDESFSLDWQESFEIGEASILELSTALRSGLLAQGRARLLSGAKLSGRQGDWSWNLGFQRDQNLLDPGISQDELSKLRYLALDRLPELSITKRSSAIGQSPIQLSIRIQWGRYREENIQKQFNEDARAEGSVQLDLTPQEIAPGIRIQAASDYSLAAYDGKQRTAWTLSPRITLVPAEGKGISMEYLVREVRGQSPFQFDQIERAETFSFQGNFGFDSGSLQWKTSYDRLKQLFSPLTFDFGYQTGDFQTQLTADYDLNQGIWRSASLVAVVKSEAGRFSLSGAYDVSASKFADWIAKLDFGSSMRIGLRLDPVSFLPRRINLQSLLKFDHGEISLNGEYDFKQNRLTAVRFGIVKKFCNDCWQIGLYGDGKQISIQARINAFPIAEVGYSPTDQSLSFGR